MRTTVALSMLLAGCLASAAIAGYTPALDPVGEAVSARADIVDRGTRRGRLQWRTLQVSRQWLDRYSPSLVSDLRAARAVSRLLDHRFPSDAEFGPRLDDALDDLAAAAYVERGALEAHAGDLPGPRRERALRGALSRFDRALAISRVAKRRVRRAQLLLRACATVSRTARRLGVDLTLPAPAPDFSLADVNPSSATYGTDVSPRSHLDRVSAWYFGHST